MITLQCILNTTGTWKYKFLKPNKANNRYLRDFTYHRNRLNHHNNIWHGDAKVHYKVFNRIDKENFEHINNP